MSESREKREANEKTAAENKTQNTARSVPSFSALLLPFRILGSTAAGIVLLIILAVLLAWGTFVESEYGAAVTRFVLYGSFWFAGLLGLLGLNLFCALLGRLPWKRHHIPFLLTHSGIIVLLAGCVWSWQRGEIAQITLPEGMVGNQAIQTDKQFFTVQSFVHNGTSQAFDIPFEPGPFHWSDYGGSSSLDGRKYQGALRWAMNWGNRQRSGFSLSRNDIQVEVLDYLANSTVEPAAPLQLNILWKKTNKITDSQTGAVQEVPRSRENVRLETQPQNFGSIEIQGTRVEMSGGERVHYFTVQSQDETESFLKGLPNESSHFGVRGQLVLNYSGKFCFINVDELLSQTEDASRFPVAGTPFEIGNVQFRARGPIISFTLYTADGKSDRMTLFPDNPEMNVQARMFGVFGNYWIQPQNLAKSDIEFSGSPMLARMSLPRLDIVQGAGTALHYRYWTGTQVTAGTVPEPVRGMNRTFTVAAGTPFEGEIVVERSEVQDFPGVRVVPLPTGQSGNEQRVKLRVSLDGKEEVFWLRILNPLILPLPPEADQVRFVYGNDRTVQIVWDYRRIDLGFGIFLKRFEKRNEPGSRMASHYSSLVDFTEIEQTQDKAMSLFRYSPDVRSYPDGENVLIAMNRPASFQGKERKYRIYQSSYQGPFLPNDPRFYEIYDARIFPDEEKPREEIFLSTFSINDDPGRGLKYLGCFLIVFGMMFYVRRKSV